MDHLAALKARNVALSLELSAAEALGDEEAIGTLSWEQMRTEDRIARIERRLNRAIIKARKVRIWA